MKLILCFSRVTLAMIGAAFFACHAHSAEACLGVKRLEQYTISQVPPDNATCQTYLDEYAAVGVSCYWKFPRQDSGAGSLADDLWRILQMCRKGGAVEPDALVNHPDSYFLRQWISGGRIYHVAVKDKASLNSTFVFFRLSQKP